MIKRTIRKIFDKMGYDINLKRSGFSLTHDLRWLKDSGIKTIFDIGANDGDFAKFISKVLPGVKIYSFEPIYECYLMLKEINPDSFNYALGDFNGESEFFKNDFSYSSSFLNISETSVENFPYTKNQSVSKVKVKTLDSIYSDLSIQDDVLVKIDVQGFEDKVLKGGESFFNEIPKIIIVETSIQRLYENEPLFDDLYNLLTKMNYVYCGNLDQLYSPLDGSILQVDAIFKKNDKV